MSTGVVRSLLVCLFPFVFIGCAESGDVSLKQSQSLTTARVSDQTSLLNAVRSRDWRAIQAAIGSNHGAPGAVIAVERGPIDGYQGSIEPVVVRHPAAPNVELLVRSDISVAAALLGVDGRLVPLTPAFEAVEGSDELLRLRLTQRDLTTQGVLLVGEAGVDLTALAPQTLALAVVDDRWECGAVQTSCATGDYVCVFESHQRCLEQDLTFTSQFPVTEDSAEIQPLVDYLQLYGAVTDVTISEQPVVNDRSGVWHALTFTAPAGAQVARIKAFTEEDVQVDLQFRVVDGVVQVLAPVDGFQPGLIVVDTSANGARFDSIGVTSSPAPALLEKACRTWSVSGCLKVEDALTQSGTTANRALVGVAVRPASATQLGLGIFLPWVPTSTDGNGCFSTSKTFCGIGAKAGRRLRTTLAWADSKVAIHNPLAWETIFNASFFQVHQNNSWTSPGSHSTGTLLFKEYVGGVLGDTERHRQALTWYVTHALDNAFNAQSSWLRYQNFYKIEYPHPLWGGVALPIVPPVVQLKANQWSLYTLVHEIGHVWHYMHNSGVMPNIVTSLINGWDTHNCHEDYNIAFLEGFAEFFQRQVLCGDVFNSAVCYWNTTPRSRNGLINHGTCNQEQGFGLITPLHVSYNDDGVTHALQLLVVDDFYKRNFLHSSNAFQPFVPSVQLSADCQWYPYDNLNLWHVLRTFRANSSLGYPTNFQSGINYGISEFYDRFRAVNNLPSGYLQDRKRLWDINAANPITVCRKPCAELSPWWTGGPKPSTLVANTRCDIEPVPAGQTAFVQSNAYFLKQPRSCPVGSYDTANCHVLTPAPGTTPFIWNNNLYTTPLPGNVCPAGSFDTANCFIAATPPGTTPFIWNGSLYTTPVIGACAAGVLLSPDHCYIGQPPTAATAQITSGFFSYPRQ